MREREKKREREREGNRWRERHPVVGETRSSGRRESERERERERVKVVHVESACVELDPTLPLRYCYTGSWPPFPSFSLLPHLVGPLLSLAPLSLSLSLSLSFSSDTVMAMT